MIADEIAICLITKYPKWYRGNLRSIKHTDKIRGDLALEFINKAVSIGYRAIVIDGKSSKSFYSALRKIPLIHLRKRYGYKRSPAKRKAIKIASGISGVQVIVLTEAEKISLLDRCLETMVAPLLSNSADIVIPKREEKLFRATYPDFQYESETQGNKIYNETLLIHKILPAKSEGYDMFFGPRAFVNKKMSSACL